jgi:hypothetical protein
MLEATRGDFRSKVSCRNLLEKCSGCWRDSPRVTDAEIGELRPQIPEWAFIECGEARGSSEYFALATSPTPWYLPIVPPRWQKMKAFISGF